jgi:lantibiotic biosynthesis dehydratase-like protein
MTNPRVCVARVTTMPFEVLERLAASATVARLGPALDLERELEAESAALGDELFRLAGGREESGPERARRRMALLAFRRALFNRRMPPGGWDPAALASLPQALAERLERHAARLEGSHRETAAIAEVFQCDRERAERALIEAMREPLAAEGLRLVSRSLLGKLRRAAALDPAAWKHGERHVGSKAVAYLGRFATKTSPNGIFCATARGSFRRGGPAVSGENRLARIQVRLNVGESRKVTASLAVDPAIESVVVPRPNPTLRRIDARWTFWKPASPRHPDDSEVRSEVPDHPLLVAFLEEAGRGELTVPRLIAAAAERCGLDPASEGVASFYRKLVAHGLLIAEAEIPWSSWRPLEDLARICRASGVHPGWLDEVEALERDVDRLGALESHARPAAMDSLETRIEALPHARELVKDDLFRVDAATAFDVAMPEAVLDELVRFTSIYARFYSAMYPSRLYRASLVRKFLGRYPPDTDIEALDLYHGIFDPVEQPRLSAFPEPRGSFDPSPEWVAAGRMYRRFRDDFANRARAAAGRDEVTMEAADWEALLGSAPAPPYSCGVLFQVAAADLEALDAGRWRACINAIYPGGGLSLSRLAALHGASGADPTGWVEDELRRGYRWLERDGAVLAEVSFMHSGRTANAGLRPPLLAHEIELPGDRVTPGRDPIPLSDLMVRFDSASSEFRLRSRSRGVLVVPVVSSGISTEGFISFLVEVGRQGTQPLAYFPGFEAEGVEVWPRFRCGRIVMSRRRWRFNAERMPRGGAGGIGAAHFVEVARWRERHGLPRHVFVHSSVDPKPFYVDLESPLFVEQMLRAVPNAEGSAAATFHVTEMLPAPDELWARDTAGRYASEFLVHLTHPESGAISESLEGTTAAMTGER